MPFIPDPADPFYDLMQPPADEMPAQKTARITRELDAQRRNDAINDQIKQDRANTKKDREVVKVLLLGQAESGKSTMLKDFRMKYAPEEWARERDDWRIVVQLNIVQFINAIVEVVKSKMNRNVTVNCGDEHNVNEPNDAETATFTDHHQHLLTRLAPLLGIEADLKQRLGAAVDEYIPWPSPVSATPSNAPMDTDVQGKRESTESVESWKDIINLIRLWQSVLNPENDTSSKASSSVVQCFDSISTTIANCKDDMKALWQDETVQVVLKRRRVQLEDIAGFFLNDLDRIAAHEYVITDDDIMRARLRTVGIQEHRIYSKPGSQEGYFFTPEWRIFDVGGCRGKRRAWLSHFDNVNVVIFFSPVSVFDQYLEELCINRLEDSFIMWAEICSSRLLSGSRLLLFLTKCDLLQRKLERGVQVRQHMLSYGDRPNEAMAVVKYLRQKFKGIARKYSVQDRLRYVFPTNITDTIATVPIMNIIRTCIIRDHLEALQLI